MFSYRFHVLSTMLFRFIDKAFVNLQIVVLRTFRRLDNYHGVVDNIITQHTNIDIFVRSQLGEWIFRIKL